MMFFGRQGDQHAHEAVRVAELYLASRCNHHEAVVEPLFGEFHRARWLTTNPSTAKAMKLISAALRITSDLLKRNDRSAGIALSREQIALGRCDPCPQSAPLKPEPQSITFATGSESDVAKFDKRFQLRVASQHFQSRITRGL